MVWNQPKISSGIEVIKVVTSLNPSRPRPWTNPAPSRKAGNAENKSAFVIHPGSIQMCSGCQSIQSASASLQRGVNALGCLFSGSESSRIADHQKYRLGPISRCRCIDVYVTTEKSNSPMVGSTIFHRMHD